jgi:uncharacterized membrane protein YtjA (UPF0391 family)
LLASHTDIQPRRLLLKWRLVTAYIGSIASTLLRADSTGQAPLPLPSKEHQMLHYAVVFFVIALIAALLGFGGIAAGAAGIAKILFILFLVMAVAAFLMGLLRKG